MSNLTIGWELLIFGMGTVFLILYLLSLAIKLMGKYLRPKEELAQPLSKPTTTTEEIGATKVAAIMAAIQLVMRDSDYKLISIRPTGSTDWKKSINLDRHGFKYGRRKGKER